MSRIANIMILGGVLVLLLGVNNAWWQYHINHSVIDMVNTSSQLRDPNINFTYSPSLSPTRTPFQPSTPTPFQPQNDPKAAIVPGIGLPAEASLIPPGALAVRSIEASSTIIGLVPDRLIIPAIQLDAPIVPIHYKTIEYDNLALEQWLVPNTFAAGWHDTSALLGLPGNTVLNGHHNAYGKVFKDLIKLELGDIIELYSGSHVFTYQVVTRMLLPERFRPIEERIANARWILTSDDERLTMITCWPPDSNTGRVVIVGFPINK